MVQRTKTDWSRIRRKVINDAEALTRQVSVGFPTNLGAIAKKQRARVEFRQLLVIGGISVSADGFVIYVGCDPGQGDELTESFEEDGTGSSLPQRIRTRARFTVAHEIGHTLCFEVGTEPGKLAVPLKTSRSLASLEQTCHLAAGALLLPEWLLARSGEVGQAAEPRTLRQLADRAIVSTETFVRRLTALRADDHPEMIVVAVQKKDSVATILAISKHYRFKSLFDRAIHGAPLTVLIDDPDFAAFGGDFTSVDKVVTYIGGAKRMYRFECEPRASKRSTSFFLTARPLE